MKKLKLDKRIYRELELCRERSERAIEIAIAINKVLKEESFRQDFGEFVAPKVAPPPYPPKDSLVTVEKK